MRPYLCYVHRPARAFADLTVVACERAELATAVADLAAQWDSFSRIDVYDGDERVMVHAPAARAA